MHPNFNIGLSAELYVASWYADNDYVIYWPMSTQSRCDFLAEKNGIFEKIQVKKATWSQTGPYKYLQCRLINRNKHAKWYEKGDFDYIVFVDDARRLWRVPFDEVEGLVSVCLDGTKEGYTTKSSKYDPAKWRIDSH